MEIMAAYKFRKIKIMKWISKNDKNNGDYNNFIKNYRSIYR